MNGRMTVLLCLFLKISVKSAVYGMEQRGTSGLDYLMKSQSSFVESQSGFRIKWPCRLSPAAKRQKGGEWSHHVRSGEAGLLRPAVFGQEDAGESRQTSALCKWLTVEEGGVTAHVDGNLSLTLSF